MEKISSNGLNFIKIDASSGYSARTNIRKIFQTYFTPDVKNTWKVVDSQNTLKKDGGALDEIDKSAGGWQIIQCPWDNTFRIKIGNDSSANNGIYIVFYDYSSGSEIYSEYSLMNTSNYFCVLRNPLYFNFIVSKSKKSFAFSCSCDINSPYMLFLCATSNKNKVGVFQLAEINGSNPSGHYTLFMYNGYSSPFSGTWDGVPYIYRTFPIIQDKSTIILPCIADNTGDYFPEVYHLISTSVKEDAEIAKSVFKINNSIYHGVMKMVGYSSYPDNWWGTGPFLLQIE